MPYIITKTNKTITPECEKQIKEELGKAITLVRGKTERWLMCEFEDSRRLWFSGTSEACAYCEIKLFGAAEKSEYDALTEKVTEILEKALDISGERIYIKYEEIANWGYNGTNF